MIKKYALYFLLSLFSAAVTADQFSTPTDRVKDSVDKVITVLKDKSLEYRRKMGDDWFGNQ